MRFDTLQNAASTVKRAKSKTMQFGPFVGGLVTVREAERCKQYECPEMTNLVVVDNDLVRTRDGVSAVCSGVAGYVVHIAEAKVNGTWRTFISSTESGAPDKHRLYYQNGTGVVEVGSYTDYSGPIHFVGYNDNLIIFDTGVVKQWTGTELQVLTDDGIGAGNFVINNIDANDSDGVWAISDITDFCIVETVPRLAYKFETPAFDAADSQIQPTFSLRAGKIGVGYGSEGAATDKVTAKIRLLSDPSTVVASKELMMISDIPMLNHYNVLDEYKQFDYKFELSEISSSILPETEYLFSIEYDNAGFDTNYLVIPGNRPEIHSGYYYSTTTTSWSSMEATIAVDLKLGIAPRADYGIVSSQRIFCFSDEEPTKVYYCGAGNQFDWSSPNYGGYMEIGRSIGGIASFYNNIWVFGTDNDPSLRKLAGNQPSEYTLTDTIQFTGAYQPTILSTPDDVFFLFSAGVGSLSTIQEFGDVRSVVQSDNIEDIIRANYDSSAFAGYDASNGIYLLKLNDSTKQTFYALHPKVKLQKTLGGRVYPTSPISKIELNLPQISSEDQTITAMGTIDGALYFGTDKGYIYKFDHSVVTDAGETVTYSLKSYSTSSRFGEMMATQVSPDVFSSNGGSYKLKFYVNHSTTALTSETITLPTSLTASDPDSGSPYLQNFDRFNINFLFRSVQLGYEDITPNGNNHIYFGGTALLAEPIGGL